MVLSGDGRITKSEFLVNARKCPLLHIREQKLKDHAKYMRDTSDEEFAKMTFQDVEQKLRQLNEFKEEESLHAMINRLKNMERTRYMKIWHDLSTVANHSHLVFLVSFLYDAATYYTDAEYKEISGKSLDVQREIEAPQLYLIARSSSSDNEQLCYVDTRVECMEELSCKLTTPSGHEVTDIMRFFHGDSPARQFECGQQKGGHYYCSNCSLNANRAYSLDYVYHVEQMSLEKRPLLAVGGHHGKTNVVA